MVLRTANGLGRPLAAAGHPLVSFDDEAVIADAQRQSRLDDFDGDGFREPLRILLDGFAREARLTLIGRVAARQDIVSLLVQRLRLVADRHRHPGIAGEEIRRPLFIVGLPRTGSTLLHHLLAQDPASRVPRAWEVMFPSPPPDRHEHHDPRVARAQRQLWWLDVLAPIFKTIHPLGAELALECIAIMSGSFLSPRFHTTYHVPTYQEWLERQDLRPAYEFHRRFLQHLQWRTPAGHWVLKAPAHLHSLDALFDTYPDALVVQTHRDPLSVLASVADLTAVLQTAFAEGVDPIEIGLEVTRRWANGLESALQARRSGRVPAERVIDVHYQDVLEDPIGVVRQIYAHFDLPLSEEVERRMRRHLARNPKDKNGVHRYSLDRFGLDTTDLRHRLKAYTEYFDIRSEHPLGA